MKQPDGETPRSPESLAVEEGRIQAAYAQRGRTERYSYFDPGNLLIVQQRERKMLAALRRHGITSLEGLDLLDVGCGTGHGIRQFILWGARPERVAGVELLENRALEARSACPAGVRIVTGSATRLAFPDASFDLVFQSTVFTSVLSADMRQRIAAEMLRVCRPHGMILWYDFHVDNPRNADVRGVRKTELRVLFGDRVMECRRITLAPPLARALAPRLWFLCEVLERIPVLCTHYLAVIRGG